MKKLKLSAKGKESLFVFDNIIFCTQIRRFCVDVIKSSINIRLILIRVLFILPVFVYAQEIESPLSIPLYLSGNFGELRSNHFHSGIDIKTHGITGIPVYAVADGYISKISVSLHGYGNSLYINHFNGTTSVYGHLKRFASNVEAWVRGIQYQNESFQVDLFPLFYQFPVKKGERIAWSGNSGGSEGPHLHFELRDTKTEMPFNPLPYFKNLIKDTCPPEILGLMIFPQRNKGIVNGSVNNQHIALIKDKCGRLQLSKSVTAWGEIGIGIKAYDRMNETTNVYGIREIILKVDGVEMYHTMIDHVSFGNTRYVNSYIDWVEWIENKSFYMKSFVDLGNRFDMNRVPGSGIIYINQEREYHLEYLLKDDYNNISTLCFKIIGQQESIPRREVKGLYFPYNCDNLYVGNGIVLNIPSGNLYSDIDLEIHVVPGYTKFSPLYVVNSYIPLHDYCPLVLEILDDSYPDKSKYGIVQYWRNEKKWIGGIYSDGKISVKIRELGQFSIEVDTLPPTIVPLKEAKWKTDKCIAFRILDNLSGIQSYCGVINGRFALFEYDAKNDTLYYFFDPKRMKPGNQILLLTVMDKVGNRMEFRTTIDF